MGAELIVGAVTAGVGAGMSFAQAKQQRVLAERAQTAAAKAMEEAKSQLQANYLEGLALPTAAYDAQREAVSQQGADILAAVSQGEDRGVAAAAGKVMAARTQAERELTSQMAKEMFELDKLKAAEDQRIGQTLASLSLQEVEGAQAAQREAMSAAARAITGGVGAIGQIGSSVIQNLNPYAGKSDKPFGETDGDEMVEVTLSDGTKQKVPKSTLQK